MSGIMITKSWNILLILGIIILLIYLLIACIGFAYLAGMGPDDYTQAEKKDSGVSILSVCTPVLIIPGIIFFYIGWQGHVKYKQFEEAADILKAYRRIKISDLARKLNTTEIEAEKMILKCIEENLIQGYMDRQVGEFFIIDSLHQMQGTINGWKCISCGGYNEKIILPGETAKCSYCGKIAVPEKIS